MIKQEIIKWINESKNLDGISTKVKNRQDIMTELNKYQFDLQTNKLSEKIYCYINDITTRPICQCGCGRKTNFESLSKGYSKLYEPSCEFNLVHHSIDDIKQEIHSWIDSGSIDGIQAKVKKRKYIIDELNKVEGRTISEKIICFLNDIQTIPKCEVCKNLLPFGSLTIGYRSCSNRKCTSDDQSKRIKDWRHSQPFEKLEEMRIKSIENRGVQNYRTGPYENKNEINIKRAETNLVRYGKKNPMQIDDFKSKAVQTLIEKYGSDNYFKTEDFRKKAEATCLEKYGNVIPMRASTVSQKMIETLLKNSFDKVNERLKLSNLTLLDSYKGTGKSYNFECTACHNKLSGWLRYDLPICRVCNPIIRSRSKEEIELFDFLKNYIDDLVPNSRILNGVEYDILSPSFKIAIEYCGLYYHSEREKSNSSSKSKDYHLNKLKNAEAHGYRLITIFSDEWINKKELVKSRLLHIFGKDNRVIGARKTHICEISNNEARIFFENNHLMGHYNAKINYALKLNDEIVSCMSFGEKRIFTNSSKNIGEYELIRFASKGNVIGAASKLFKHFVKEKNPDKIISYADLRWSNGNIYKILGFELESISDPGYWYTSDYCSREHRFKYRKSILIKNTPDLDYLTEWEIQQMNGFDRVWDCGQMKWKWESN